jgi:hypothetical protein
MRSWLTNREGFMSSSMSVHLPAAVPVASVSV